MYCIIPYKTHIFDCSKFDWIIMKTIKAFLRLHGIRGLVCLLLFWIAVSGASAQSTGFIIPKLSPEALRKDFSSLRDTLVKIHPGIYRYRSEAHFKFIFDSCYSAINDSMAVTKFYAFTTRLIGAIEDGHTNCRL